ncbi:hypothetical protein ACQP2C_32380 [Micromonospora zamorensis]|uniref:hypothetical protein n=1 Tax=Micromonospora zamorensis TaxID=709883 RepID=UPI003D9980F7
MSTSTAELDSLRRSAKVINVLAWGVVALIMVYGTPIVFEYLTKHGVPRETAWMLSLATDGALAVGLVATPVLAQHGIKAGWVGALRWIAGLATWALNTSDSWSHKGGPDVGGVISHSWGPLLMFAAVEGAAYFGRKISEVIRKKEAEATKRVDDLAEFRTRAEDADRKRAAAEAALRAEERTRAEAEERAEAEAAGRKRAEERAAVEAEARAEESRESEAEIARLIRHAEDVQASARDARAQAAEQSELAARISGQLDEARLMAERAIAEKMNAEQHISALEEAHTAVAQELERVRQSYARLQSRAENPGRRQAEISAPPKRKKTPALPPALLVAVPPVEGVASGTVARVISAYRANPSGTQKAIAAAAGTTDRTVRTVLSNIPADHPALAIEATATQEN